MIIEETDGCYEFEVYVSASETFCISQHADWLQIDKEQARKLVEALNTWLDGNDVD